MTQSGEWGRPQEDRRPRKYEVESLGIADDMSDPDGVAILSYWQAQEKARERMVQRAHAAAGKSGPYTVADAMEDYYGADATSVLSGLDYIFSSAELEKVGPGQKRGGDEPGPTNVARGGLSRRHKSRLRLFNSANNGNFRMAEIRSENPRATARGLQGARGRC